MHPFLCLTVIFQNVVRDADDELREIPVAGLAVFRAQNLVERFAYVLVFIEEMSKPLTVLLDGGAVFFVAQDIERQEEEKTFLENLVE